jgi:hypothetical protein
MTESYTVAPGVLTQELDGETILLVARTGTYFRLNPTGTQVWAAIASGRDVGSVVVELADEGGADPEVVRADVTSLLGTLLAKGLVSTTP